MGFGGWVAIFGQNLASIQTKGRTWRDDEIINGMLPTSLDGVSVHINGRPAALYFVGPQQLNAQVPDNPTLGPVPVVVTTPYGTARTVAEVKELAPGLFTGPDYSGTRFAAAVFADGTIVGRNEVSVGSRPAR